MSNEQKETVDTSVERPGEKQAQWRPPPRRGDAGYRRRGAVIGIAAVPSAVLGLLLLCLVSGAIQGVLGDVFGGEPISVYYLLTVPAVLEGLVLVPGIYSLARGSRWAGSVTLALAAVAVPLYLVYSGIFWVIVLTSGHAGAFGH